MIAQCDGANLIADQYVSVPTQMRGFHPPSDRHEPIDAAYQKFQLKPFLLAPGGIFKKPDHAKPSGFEGPVRRGGKENAEDAAVAGLRRFDSIAFAALATLSFFLFNSSRQVG